MRFMICLGLLLSGWIVCIAGPALVYSAPVFGTAWDESYHYSANPDENTPRVATTWPSLDGVPTDHNYLAGEKELGIQTRNVYLRWAEYEPTEGNYDVAYRNQKIKEADNFRQAGFSVVLRINPFPVPAWYFIKYPDARYKNQYGVEWAPDLESGKWNDPEEKYNTQVSLWHQPLRTHLSAYFNDVFQSFGTNFWAVYVSVGQHGEVSFPGRDPNDDSLREDYYGHKNCYWAYDAAAQAQCPLPGWRPGDVEPGQILGSGERVVNGGFEDTRYAATIANWESKRQSHGTSWYPSVLTGGAPVGSRYLQFVGPAGQNYALFQEITVRPNANVTLSGYIKTKKSATTGRIRLIQLDSQGTTVAENEITSSSTSWKKKSANIVLNPLAVKARVELYITGTVDKVWFDGSSVTDGLTMSHSKAQQFADWYYGRLADQTNWMIGALRQYYSGRLILMGGGFSALSGDVEAELANNLSGNTKDHYWVSRGFVPDRYLAAISNRVNVMFANTSLEQNWRNWKDITDLSWEASPLQSDWSQPHYFSYLANLYSMEKYGENGGKNNQNGMSQFFVNMSSYGYAGVAWYTAGQLFEPQYYASIKDYASKITQYGGPAAKPNTETLTYALKTGWEAGQPQGDQNNVLYVGNVTGLSPDTLPVARTENSGYEGVQAHNGGKYYYVSGSILGDGAYCYYKLFDMNYTVPTDQKTRLSYWIYNRNAVNGNTHVCVDLIFDDGTALRNTGITDQRGMVMHPAQRNEEFDQWVYVEADLTSLGGKKLWEVRVGFDTGSAGEHYQAFIDDLKIYSGANPGKEPLSTGWETGEPLGYDSVVLASSGNVQGAVCAPVAAEGSVSPFRGNGMLVAAGNVVNTDSTGYCYTWLFNDALKEFNNIKIVSGMKLVYRVLHRYNPHLSVDFKCTDGTELRNQASITDQNGVRLHPAYRNDALDQWVRVEADLSPLAGKIIEQVNIGFEEASQTGPYRSYIDDLQFTTEPLVP